MNKKFLALIFLLLTNTINVNSAPPATSLSLKWINPPTSPYILPLTGTLDINTTITCSGLCDDTTATLQYCKGETCINYADIQASGEIKLLDSKDSARRDLGILTGSTNIGWTINWPDAPYGKSYNLKITADSTTTDETSIAGRQLQTSTLKSSASILAPIDGNTFFIGSNIEFKSNTICVNSPCTVRWDSNKDTEWHSTDENFTYSGLSIGDHNISLELTDSTQETTEDSIKISINSIPADVLSISNFQIIKIDPLDRFAANGKIEVTARVNYHASEEIDAKAFIIISDPRNGQAKYGPAPFYLRFRVPSYEDFDLNIDLSNYGFEERENYKIEFLVVSNYVESTSEYFVDPADPNSAYWDDGEPYFIPEEQIPEQNKANNSGYLIVELGPTTLGDLSQMPETNSTAILLILFAVLILIRKK